jgi:hypothetical protein
MVLRWYFGLGGASSALGLSITPSNHQHFVPTNHFQPMEPFSQPVGLYLSTGGFGLSVLTLCGNPAITAKTRQDAGQCLSSTSLQRYNRAYPAGHRAVPC